MTTPLTLPPGGLAPNSVIGIVGGGQLGRMSALAAARLGYRCHILTAEADSPAAQVAHGVTLGDYDRSGDACGASPAPWMSSRSSSRT